MIYPDYYPRFKCIASACKHNCCIGWEIDVDPETAAFYQALDTPLGERLRANVDPCPQPHFVLTQEKRCPFLNKDNLCDIIAQLGEDGLCDICYLHPRFCNDLPHGTEMGLGLCCEAAGALILGQKEPMRLMFDEQTVPTETALRDELMALLQDRRFPLRQRLQAMMQRCHVHLPYKAPALWAELFLSLERLDPQWTHRLQALRGGVSEELLCAFETYMEPRQTEYEQFAVYLLYRHFVAVEPAQRGALTALIALCCELIYWLGALQWQQTGTFSFEEQVELCRAFSAEIEYSEENLSTCLQAFLTE